MLGVISRLYDKDVVTNAGEVLKPKHAGISKEELEETNRDLWAVLVSKCEGDALQKVLMGGQGEGLWGLIRFTTWYSRTTGLGRTLRRMEVMKPEAVKNEWEVATAVERWEEKYRRMLQEDGEDELPDTYKRAALMCIVTGDIKRHF